MDILYRTHPNSKKTKTCVAWTAKGVSFLYWQDLQVGDAHLGADKPVVTSSGVSTPLKIENKISK